MNDRTAEYRKLMGGFRGLNEVQPAVMDGFGRMHRGATADGALLGKHKELIALAIAVAQGCDGCITIHAHDAVRAGATAPEADDAVGVAVLMGGGPAAVYGAKAREAIAEFIEAAAE